jgi:hypothetical protein
VAGAQDAELRAGNTEIFIRKPRREEVRKADEGVWVEMNGT